MYIYILSFLKQGKKMQNLNIETVFSGFVLDLAN